MRLLAWYGRQVERRPILAQSVMTSALVSTGDIIAQLGFSKDPYDAKRTLKFSAIGLFYGGPILAKWYLWLEPFAARKFRYLPKSVVVKKVILDQFVLQAPYTAGVLTINGLLNGVSISDTFPMIKSNMLGILMAAWPYWCSVQTINFKYIPFAYRMLTMQIAAILWNVFLSWKASNAAQRAIKQNDKQD